LVDDIRIYNRVLGAADSGELASVVVGGQVLVTNEIVTTNTGVAFTLSSNELLTIDSNTSDYQLVYTVTQLNASAYFSVGGVQLGISDTFTQEDINLGLVSVHTASSTAEVIGFSVDDGQGYVTNALFTVDSPNAAPPPPISVYTSLGLYIAENSDVGVSVGAVDTNGNSGTTYTYSLLDDAGGRFTIDSSSGQVFVAAGANLNFEATAMHQIEVQSTDNYSQSVSSILTVNVLDINDAPVLSPPIKISPVTEDDVNNNGDLIRDVYNPVFTDQDLNGEFTGIAITVNNSTTNTGTWQYQSVGAGWVDVGVVSKANPLVLGAEERIRYVPVLNYNGNAGTLVVHAIDNSENLPLPIVAHYDNTLFDASGVPATTRLTPVGSGLGAVIVPDNDAPHGANANQPFVVDENAPIGTSLGYIIGHDVDDTTFNFTLTGNSGGRFAIDSVTGILLLAKSRL